MLLLGMYFLAVLVPKLTTKDQSFQGLRLG